MAALVGVSASDPQLLSGPVSQRTRTALAVVLVEGAAMTPLATPMVALVLVLVLVAVAVVVAVVAVAVAVVNPLRRSLVISHQSATAIRTIPTTE